MNIRTVKIAYAYRMTCVPKGCQNERTILAAGETVVAIPLLDPDDATPAFRLRYPADDPNRYRWSGHRGGDAWLLRAATLELIAYDGATWWPWCLPNGKSRYEIGTEGELTAQLTDHSRDVLGLTPDHLRDLRVVTRPATRSISVDDSDVTAALAQRKAYRNFVILRGRVYVRGGEPIYAKLHHGRVRSWEIDICNTGPDRTADMRLPGIDRPPGRQLDRGMWEALAAQAFWTAEMTVSARAAAHRMQHEIPTIERLGAKSDPALPVNLTIDSIFRLTMDMAREDYSIRGDFKRMCKRGLEAEDASEITQARVSSLCAFLREGNDRHRGLRRLRDWFARFEKEHAPAAFSAEDEEALAALG